MRATRSYERCCRPALNPIPTERTPRTAGAWESYAGRGGVDEVIDGLECESYGDRLDRWHSNLTRQA
jgi:hypothetical protein